MRASTDRLAAGETLEAEVLGARIDQLYEKTYPALANPMIAAVVVALAWEQFPESWLVAWLIVMCVVTALRLLLCRWWRTDPTRRIRPKVWEDRMVASVGVNGCAWCLLGVGLATQELPIEVQGAATIAACGMIAGATFSFSASLKAFYAYVVPTALGPIIGLLLAGGDQQVGLAVMGAVYFLVALVWGRQAARTLERSLRLRHENAALNVDLEAARYRLIEAERIRSESFANVGHELRTPLNAIIGFAGSIEAEIWGPLGDTRYKKYATLIAESGQHLLALIQDILEVSRDDVGGLSLAEEVVDLNALLEGCGSMIAEAADEAGISVEIIEPVGSLRIQGDPTKLRQIVINLATNALQFTPRGGIVSLRTDLGMTGDARIQVADTGVGMSREDAERAVEAYVQIVRDRAGVHKGLGLGLTLSKRMADLHGGRLEIESELGKGTTVTVTLPSDRVV